MVVSSIQNVSFIVTDAGCTDGTILMHLYLIFKI